MKTFRTPTSAQGSFSLDLTAPSAQLSTKTTPDLGEAVVEVSGPIEVLEKSAAHREGSRWVITLPESSSDANAHVSRDGGVRNEVRGNVTGSVIQTGDINGPIDMNSFHVQSGAGTSPPTPIRITALLPEGTDLTARVGGKASLMGHLGRVDVSAGSGNVAVNHGTDVTIDTSSGDILVLFALEEADVSTGSGDITVRKSAPRRGADKVRPEGATGFHWMKESFIQ